MKSKTINNPGDIHAAAMTGNLEELKRLVNVEGVDINKVDEKWFGYTPLIYASANGFLNIVSFTLDSGALVDLSDDSARSPLMIASERGHLNIVSLLLDRGAFIDHQSNFHFTPLILASRNGKVNVVTLLLNRGANPLLEDGEGKTALDRARDRNNSDCAVILEKYEHFHRYRKVWLSFSTSLNAFQDNQNQNQESKQSQIQSPSLRRVMDSSDLVRYVTEFM